MESHLILAEDRIKKSMINVLFHLNQILGARARGVKRGNSTTKEQTLAALASSFLSVSSFQRPRSLGGRDQGVSPQDYSETFLFLLAALSSRHVLDRVTISTRPVASDMAKVKDDSTGVLLLQYMYIFFWNHALLRLTSYYFALLYIDLQV